MSELKFKTNIKCSGCLAKVAPHLDKLAGIEKWSVDIAEANKVLTVNSELVNDAQVITAVAEAGYQAELIN